MGLANGTNVLDSTHASRRSIVNPMIKHLIKRVPYLTLRVGGTKAGPRYKITIAARGLTECLMLLQSIAYNCRYRGIKRRRYRDTISL